MSKENFHTLLSRYRSGTCTDQEKRLVEQWFATLDQEIPERSGQENEVIEERLWNAIQHRTEDEKPAVRIFLWKWAAAAIILLALGWAGYQYKNSQIPGLANSSVTGSFNKNLVTETNNSDSPRTITLPDSSEIQLSPGSSISYEPRFADVRREVYLTGKAFFHVHRNTERPFFVHSGEVVTKVLGTSFWVHGNDDNSAIEVSVITGKVSVSEHINAYVPEESKIKNGVILTANQRVKYTTQTHSFETGLVSNPVLVVTGKKGKPVEHSFDFQDNPFSEVISKLEESYGIEIILEDETFAGCLFSGNITKQPLFTKLDLLCSSVNASYEVRGTRILISGKGCSVNN
jgi:ferric-dicitrate binding protein FerR (iron transport regulator)